MTRLRHRGRRVHRPPSRPAPARRRHRSSRHRAQRGSAAACGRAGCDVVVGDVLDAAALRHAPSTGCDVAYHLAGDYRVGIRAATRPAMEAANVTATERAAGRGDRGWRRADRPRLDHQRVRRHRLPGRRRDVRAAAPVPVRQLLRRDEASRAPRCARADQPPARRCSSPCRAASTGRATTPASVACCEHAAAGKLRRRSPSATSA